MHPHFSQVYGGRSCQCLYTLQQSFFISVLYIHPYHVQALSKGDVGHRTTTTLAPHAKITLEDIVFAHNHIKCVLHLENLVVYSFVVEK